MKKLAADKKGLILLLLVVLAVAAAIFERHHLRRALKRRPLPRGAVEHLAFFSPALNREAGYWAWLPPGADASGRVRYPVLYLLHGLFRDDAAYLYRVDVDLAADRLRFEKKIAPLILIMPEGDASFYVNWNGDHGDRWEDYMVRDLIAEVDRRFPTIRDRRGRGIGGFSMGGFGALRLALLHRDLYGSASSEYGAFQLGSTSLPYLGKVLNRAFGDDPKAYEAESPLHLIESTHLRPGELAIYLDAGEEDAWALDDQARDFDRRLTAAGISHVFHVFPGNHTDSFLREHVAEVLQFHSNSFAEK